MLALSTHNNIKKTKLQLPKVTNKPSKYKNYLYLKAPKLKMFAHTTVYKNGRYDISVYETANHPTKNNLNTSTGHPERIYQ